jgi:hypothetical protein
MVYDPTDQRSPRPNLIFSNIVAIYRHNDRME